MKRSKRFKNLFPTKYMLTSEFAKFKMGQIDLGVMSAFVFHFKGQFENFPFSRFNSEILTIQSSHPTKYF